MTGRIPPLAMLAVLLLVSGCAAPSSTPDGSVPGEVAPVESLLVEEQFDLSVSGGHISSVSNFAIQRYPLFNGDNAVYLRDFAGTNITSVHARVDYVPVATSTGVYALRAGLGDDRGSITQEETIGSGPLELELSLADLWTDRQGDLAMRIRLWPHGDVAVAYGQDFSMIISVHSTDPDDRVPDMNQYHNAG